jgi:hypothetical protein
MMVRRAGMRPELPPVPSKGERQGQAFPFGKALAGRRSPPARQFEEHIGEVVLRVEAVELGGFDQGVDRGGAAAAGIEPAI